MSYTLLIWEQVPEQTDLYIIPNEEVEKDNRLELMKQAHNNFINASEYSDGLSFLNSALCDIKHINDDSYFNDGDAITKLGCRSKKEWRCIFAKHKVNNAHGIIDDIDITRVILSGFIM